MRRRSVQYTGSLSLRLGSLDTHSRMSGCFTSLSLSRCCLLLQYFACGTRRHILVVSKLKAALWSWKVEIWQVEKLVLGKLSGVSAILKISSLTTQTTQCYGSNHYHVVEYDIKVETGLNEIFGLLLVS